MNAFYDLIRGIFAMPFGLALSFFYDITGSYIVSIVALTLVIKLLLLPLSIIQQKKSAKQVRLNTKVNKIKKKYAGNQQKIQQETQALYQREGFSVGNIGCAPIGIQMLIMIGLYGIIYTPLSSVLRMSADKVSAMKDVMTSVIPATGNESRFFEITLLDKFSDFTDKLTGVLSTADLADLAQLKSRFNIFGLELSVTPDKGHFDAYWLIPIIAFLTAFLSSGYMFLKQRKQNPEMAKNPTMGCMTFMSPVMSLVFTFMFPAGVGFYWIISNVISFFQQIILTTFYSPKKVIAQQMVDETVVRRSKENNTKLRVENEKK